MEGFIGQIMLFASNFAPRNWAFCEGQLLPIAQNTALFSILGTTYGGDGRTTFALPDFRGRAAVSEGAAPGLSTHRLGSKSGQESVVLNATNLPNHGHSFAPAASSGSGNEDTAENNFVASATRIYMDTSSALVNMVPTTLGNTGGNQAHNNMQPSLVLNMSFAYKEPFLQGVN